MDWLATLFEHDCVITFRALTDVYKDGALIGDREDWIGPGQESGGWNFGQL